MFSVYVVTSISTTWNLSFEICRPNLYEILSTFMRTTYSTHLNLLDLFTVIIQQKGENTEFLFSASFFGFLMYKYFLQAETIFLP